MLEMQRGRKVYEMNEEESEDLRMGRLVCKTIIMVAGFICLAALGGCIVCYL